MDRIKKVEQEKPGGRKPLPLNKGVEKQAQCLRDFFKRGLR